jgi:hypothetical protein
MYYKAGIKLFSNALIVNQYFSNKLNFIIVNYKKLTMKESLNFYDLKSKLKFNSTDYEIRKKGKRFFAVTKSLSGPYECWRVLTKALGEKLFNEQES